MGKAREPAWRNTGVDICNKIFKRQKISPFRCNYAEIRYKNYTSKQTLHMERGLVYSHSNPHVSQVIESHKWKTFCERPSNASCLSVLEFYANYDRSNPNSVYVRGRMVDVSSRAINSFFSLANHQNTLFENVSNISAVKMDKILKELTEPGTQWTSKEDMNFSRRYLKVGPKIWYKFIKYNLFPSANDRIVEKDAAVLLYCIMTGKPINVGKVIVKQIRVCAGFNERGRGLWFPALITRLCAQSKDYLSHTKRMKQHSDPVYVDEISHSDEETNNLDQETSKDRQISQSDQETNQSDRDRSSPITILSDQSRDDIMLISSGNSGDDELSDVEQESCELAEDESPMSDYAQSILLGEKLFGSRIKVWCPEDKTYYEGVVKSFNSKRKKHKILYDFGEEVLNLKKEQWEVIENVYPKPNSDLIDDNDDGVEELLNLKKEHGELDENVSSISDCLQNGIICVQGYKVKENFGPILKSIFEKHGDIAAECVFKTASLRSSFLESICEVVTLIQTNNFTEKMEEMESKVSDAAKANINVSWIRAHLDTIRKRTDILKKSSLFKEMKANTVLATLAAQKDLIEKCGELVAAQERFADAERCVRVLRLVDKNLNKNILEFNSEKDSWVEKPIL